MIDDRIAPCALAEDGDVLTVATECCDVCLRPSDRHPLILDAEVAGAVAARRVLYLRAAQKAEDVQPVVDRDDDDAVIRGGNEARSAVVVARTGLVYAHTEQARQ